MNEIKGRTLIEADDIEALIADFLTRRQLPESYGDMIRGYWLPLAERLEARHEGRTMLVGINGAQGCGKSTMAAVLQLLLQRRGLRTLVVSIDDLYFTRSERKALAEQVHPLLETRGVPGTHDIRLIIELFGLLRLSGPKSSVSIPGFDKAVDDRLPRDQWPLYRGTADVILLEGWCVGIPPQSDAELEEPVNDLEREEDADGSWRSFVNRALASDYLQLFSMLDLLIMLKAPDFETVYQWRGKQEAQLRRAHPDASHVMNQAQLSRFISHYERLTRHALKQLPELADVVFTFDHQHKVTGAEYRSGRV